MNVFATYTLSQPVTELFCAILALSDLPISSVNLVD